MKLAFNLILITNYFVESDTLSSIRLCEQILAYQKRWYDLREVNKKHDGQAQSNMLHCMAECAASKETMVIFSSFFHENNITKMLLSMWEANADDRIATYCKYSILK